MVSLQRFGDYAVDLGYCTRADVERAVRIQIDLVNRGFPRTLIGLIMVRYGILANHELIGILKVLERNHVEAILPS